MPIANICSIGYPHDCHADSPIKYTVPFFQDKISYNRPNIKILWLMDFRVHNDVTPGCPVLLFFLFFPIFSGLPIFSYILIPNPIFFHQIPIFFKMLQIIMKYQGKIMEFWFERPVLMSLAFIFFPGSLRSLVT